MKFAMIGAAGYVAPRHMKAIKETGNELVIAADLNDSVGILDSYFPNCKFFTDMPHFWEAIEQEPVDYLSICSPNNYHYVHCLNALSRGAHVICEKPLTITSKRAESLTGIDPTRINVILQLRISPMMLEIKKHIEELLRDNPCQLNVTMKYITPRGPWYHASWKGDENCSGGILMNIGIHLFDILIWLFGAVNDFTVGIRSKIKAEGVLSLQSAKVDWFLSLDWNDLPYDTNTTYRSLNIDGQDYRFDKVFADLHTQAYSHILEGKGFGPLDALPSIALVEKLNNVTQTAQPK